MTLAFQCGRWDLDVFEGELSASLMTRWQEWFSRRPQGQRHQDRMLARGFAAIMQSKGADLEEYHFMAGYEAPKADEDLSIDEQCSAALSQLPKTPKPIEGPVNAVNG
jgi:hypothetical protein